MTKISILGCGWLGLPLAKQLIANDFLVKGSTTSENKILYLKNNKIEPFVLWIDEQKIIGDFANFLKESTLLIINIPPGLRKNPAGSFVEKIKKMIPFIENSTIKKVIFISSIAVYTDNNQTVTEKNEPNPENESGKQIYETERLLKNNKNFQTTIIRFGGLIGADRHPIYSLSGKKNIANPQSFVNLIDQTDCIKIIVNIINQKQWNQVFNAVADEHPTKKEYYTKKAIELSLPMPEFDLSKPSFGKKVLSEKLNHSFVKI